MRRPDLGPPLPLPPSYQALFEFSLFLALLCTYKPPSPPIIPFLDSVLDPIFPPPSSFAFPSVRRILPSSESRRLPHAHTHFTSSPSPRYKQPPPPPHPTIQSPVSFLVRKKKKKREELGKIVMDQHAQRMHSYLHALEEEKRKIQVFHRELPLCLDLVIKAIENYRQQFSGTTTENVHVGQSECLEQTSTWGPVLEEFIPIKRSCSGSDYNDDETEQDSGHKWSEFNGGLVSAEWLKSAQIWNQTSSVPPHKDAPPPKRVPVLEVKRNGGAFRPFNREKGATINNVSVSLSSKPSSLSLDKTHSVIPSAATSSTAETVAASAVSGQKEDREPAQPHRKQRRNWSPELHRRFLLALEQLGGSHSSTPKQIKELMKVDGLTNDEVKSHLQKYRLHTRRPGPTLIPAASTAQAPQFVVVGGIWLPHAAAPPLANLDLEKQPDESEGRGSHSGGEEEGGSDRSNWPSTSSSTHTTSASRPQ